MNTMDRILITEDGAQDLRRELSLLRRAQGSKVAEYRSTLDREDPGEAISRYLMSEVASIDRRIVEIEDALSRAVVVGPRDVEKGVVGVGSRVGVRWGDGEEDEYVIVGPPELDYGTDEISYDSPVGRALIGKREGDRVEVSTPDGSSGLQIVKVESAGQ